MSKDVDVTYDDMRRAAKHLKTERTKIDDKLDKLKDYVDGLVSSGYVTKRSSKEFQTSFEEFKKGASQAIEGLEGMAKFLDTAADKFEQLDEDLAKGVKGG
ncbi:WXG100 family type VII secretion target [Streptomyces sp. bgisy100]|uniref:WXG100 family type VII secretion target n=1 Tax=Streptomyces sp. bgisy100 TaxID=3413783 RepID=UPI003D70A537